MAEPLWRCYDANKCLSRQQLELIVQKKKLSEIYLWFEKHFKTLSTSDYINQCPIVIVQGPSGCGKTTTLKFIANELKIPIKEYSETTDVTAINLDLMQSNRDEATCSSASQTINRRKALKFEHFVLNSLRYNTLYPADDPPADADSDCEFDQDDSFAVFTRPKNPPPNTGVIIHVDTPLTFAKCQRVLIKTLQNIIRTIRGISRHLKRRIAIVFETLEGDNETLPLPTKVKNTFGIQIFKFNPIIRTHLKKFIESITKQYSHVIFDKDTIDQLVSDCGGDLRACINTLQIICNKSNGTSNALSKIDHNASPTQVLNAEAMIPFHMSAIKKQKLSHEKVRYAEFTPSLMRDSSRATSFFHALGKIFYQKRLYPEVDYRYLKNPRIYRSIDRPYPTENSTDHLASLIDSNPKNLIIWLHEHYYKYCADSKIEKAALFLENLSTTDTTSINSLQSSQFYEMHNTLDQLQTSLAIESTVYSLYENRYNVHISSHKRIPAANGQSLIIKTSVENLNQSSKEDKFFSYYKPLAMNLPKVTEGYQKLLNECTAKLVEINQSCIDPSKVLVDYAPYMTILSDKWQAQLTQSRDSEKHPIFDDQNLDSCFRALQTMEDESEDVDFEMKHEKLQELIDNLL